MLQVICRPEATNKEDAYTFHTVHSKQQPCIFLCCGDKRCVSPSEEFASDIKTDQQ